MTWVLGNLPGCHPTEIFAARLRTRAPAVGLVLPEPVVADQAQDPESGPAAGRLPRTLEEWAAAQQEDGEFAEMLDAVCGGKGA